MQTPNAKTRLLFKVIPAPETYQIETATDSVRPLNRFEALFYRVKQFAFANGSVRRSYHSSVAASGLAQLALQPFDTIALRGNPDPEMYRCPGLIADK